ncbi:MAG: phosphopyruvate hydratase [Eubacteriales bacterium]
MQIKIKNRDVLLSHGDVESRRIVLDITEKTLQYLDAYERIKSIAHMEGDILCIGSRRWDLSKKRNVYLLGAGKACNHMAMAVDEILGDHLTKGIAIVKISEPTDVFRHTDVYVGGHPLPNEEGLRACKEILKIVDNAGPDDLFIVVISGGSSALMSCPIEGITLQDEIDTTDIMLKSGAGIYEINAIRRHISAMNGGMLAKRIEARGAELIGFGISDAVGTPATGDIGEPYKNYKGTPMGPDQTTLEQARQVIHDYGVEDRLPKAVVDYLMNVGPEGETPKAFPNNTYFLLNSLPDSCLQAKKVSEEMGIPAVILSSFIEGESRDVGTLFASIAREIQNYGNPVKPPCVLLASGEATTKILDNSTITGHGGPGQELTLSFAISAQKAPGCALLSIDSEGTDGTTSVAGGITDSKSYGIAVEKGVDVFESLRGHACFEALDQMGDAVFTGNTGTNLCDLNIMYVPALPEKPAKKSGPRIKAVHARQLIDCKCRPMVEVDVITEDGYIGTGAAPTGSSVGMYESCVLRDGNPDEYNGLSVHKAVANVNDIIAPALIGMDVTDQKALDQKMIELDGTPDKHVLGGNAIYSVSIACLRAAAASQRRPLYDYLSDGNIKTVPIPSFNVINGGRNNGITQAFNEFIVMPYRAKDIEEAVEIAVKVFQTLGPVIQEYTGKPPAVGGSYGWVAPSEDPEVCLNLIQKAIDRCGYTDQCAFALDCAISEMYDAETKTYYLNGKQRTTDEIIDYVKGLTEKYNFVFIEDMLDENDWEGYEKAHKVITRTLIIADDFTVSNRQRIERAVSTNSIDGFILKPNQVGTISEALDAHYYADEHGLFSITSGRSGGVIGDVVMDLAVGLQIPFIKNGCPRSGERIDKLNFLMRVKDDYAGCHMANIDKIVKF